MKRLTLGDVCKKESSNIAQKDLQDKKGAYPIYGASGLIKQVDFYQQDKEYIAVVKDGAGIGRTMLLPAYSSVIGTMQYLLPKEGIPIDIKYLFYAVEHMNLAKYFSGATIPHIYFRDYQKEPINIPDIETQRKISQIFGKIDALITSRKEQRTKLDQIVKSRFIEMFGNLATNSKGWEETTVGKECFYIKDGPHKSLHDIGKENGGHPFISVRNIVNHAIDFTTAKYISDEDYADAIKKCHPEKGDMLYSKGGTTGIAKLIDIDEKFANWVHVAVLKFDKDKLNGLFFENMLNSDYCYGQSQRLTKGIANRDLVLSAIAQIKMYRPPMQLQNEFSDFVVKTDKSKYRQEKCIRFFQCLEKNIRQEWL